MATGAVRPPALPARRLPVDWRTLNLKLLVVLDAAAAAWLGQGCRCYTDRNRPSLAGDGW